MLALSSRDEFVHADDPGTEGRRSALPDLQSLVASNSEALPKARDKALGWLRSQEPTKPDDLNEKLVVRLLIARRFGTKEEAGDRLKELLARQNADGGWSADPSRRQPSDAFATGQSLYAIGLGGPGAAGETAAIERAVGFLSALQKEGGSWFVPTTAFHPPAGSERDHATDEVYTYWGTAWATLGLLHTLPVIAEGVREKRE